MTIREIYREYLQDLRQIYDAGEASVITDWVFEKTTGLQRSDIIKDPGQLLKPETLQHLNHCLAELVQHKPVQYVLGEAWFFRMKLSVNENVLIPRPETEELVQLAIDDCLKVMDDRNSSLTAQRSGNEEQLSGIDIGTGSGCIAIALKKNLPRALIHAIDISAGALSVAKENAVQQRAKIEFLLLDFLAEDHWNRLPVFDVIISNPPYIPLNEKDKLDKNVAAFEPPAALFVPDDTPLLFYQKIADFGKKHLHKNGKIYVEMHEDFAKATAELFERSYTVEVKKDVFGKERMLVASFRDL